MTSDRAVPRSPGTGAGEEAAGAASSPAPASSGPRYDGDAAASSGAQPRPEAEQEPLPAAGGRRTSEPADAETARGEQAEEIMADEIMAEEVPGEPAGEGAPGEAAEEAAPGEPAEEADGRRLERDLDELAAKAQKADEYLELAQRTRADFENYRKRAARESAVAQQRGVAKLARELLPALDNLDRALAAAREAGDGTDLAAGIELVHADVIAALGRVGIEPYSPEGEPFDPERHEAVAQQPVEGAQPGTVVEVYQRGYRHGDSVLRPARVLVAG